MSGNATLIIKFEIGYPLPATYPDPLKNKTFLVLYRVEGKVEQVADVYDDHPVIHSSHTTRHCDHPYSEQTVTYIS